MTRIGKTHYSDEYETSIEVLRGEGDAAEYVEVEVVMHFNTQAPEPDVGLFGFGVDDYEFTLPDGSPLPDDVVAAIDADDKWTERQCERAIENYEPYEPDYDREDL